MLKPGLPASTWSTGVTGTCDCIALSVWAFPCGFHYVECSLLEKLGVPCPFHLLKNHFSGGNRLATEVVKCRDISVTKGINPDNKILLWVIYGQIFLGSRDQKDQLGPAKEVSTEKANFPWSDLSGKFHLMCTWCISKVEFTIRIRICSIPRLALLIIWTQNSRLLSWCCPPACSSPVEDIPEHSMLYSYL